MDLRLDRFHIKNREQGMTNMENQPIIWKNVEPIIWKNAAEPIIWNNEVAPIIW